MYNTEKYFILGCQNRLFYVKKPTLIQSVVLSTADGTNIEDDNQSTTSSTATGTSTNTRRSQGSRKRGKKKGRDFIKRNIQVCVCVYGTACFSPSKMIGLVSLHLKNFLSASCSEDRASSDHFFFFCHWTFMNCSIAG